MSSGPLYVLIMDDSIELLYILKLVHTLEIVVLIDLAVAYPWICFFMFNMTLQWFI